MQRKSRANQPNKVEHPTRRVRYCVAMSLDGYIAGPNGEADWIVMDPDADFEAYTARFDTMLMGRRTYEAMMTMGGGGSTPGTKVVVASRKLRQEDHRDVTVVADPAKLIADLRAKPGKDIWLFGGGNLFRSLLELELIDTVEVGVVPVLLGGGVPLLPPPATRATLKLTGHKVYAKTGTVGLEYAVQHSRAKRSRVTTRKGR